MKSILCAGCVTTDVIVSPVDALPEPGQLAAVGSTQVHVGGCAANAAIDLAKLGLPAMLCALVGGDSFGRFVRDTAQAAGVDVSGLVMKKGWRPPVLLSAWIPRGSGASSIIPAPHPP